MIMNKLNKWLLLALVCAFTLTLGACSEEGDSDTNTTADGTSSGPDGTCQENTNTCGLKGKEFDAATCTCKDPSTVVGDCANVDDFCDADLPQPDGFLCLELSEPDPETGKTGACAQTCEGFFNDTCPIDAACMPKNIFDVAKDICVPAGTVAEGEDCQGLLDCQKGLVCVGVCVAPDCSPITTAKSCAEANEVCDGLTLTDGTRLDIGFCFQPCDGFATPSTCDSGEWCSPGQTKENGKFPGSCVAGGGSKGPGAACTANTECADGSFCFGDGSGGGACGVLCDSTLTTNTGPGACGEGQGCGNLVIENEDGETEELDLGTCVEACDFDGGDACNDTTDTCIPGEIRGGTFDSCGNTPSKDPYATCTAAEEFQYCNSTSLCMELAGSGYDGYVCHQLCRFAEGAAGSLDHKDCGGEAGGKVCATRFSETFPVGVCTTVDCDPTQTDSGACEATEGCRLISADNDQAGQCQPACNYDDAASTCADGKQCYAGEILGFFQAIDGISGDFCDDLKPDAATRWPLNPGEACDTTNKIEEFELCGPLAMCLEISQAATGVRCYEFCRSSEKAFGSTAHPDCNSPTQTCTAVFQSTELGVCLGQ